VVVVLTGPDVVVVVSGPGTGGHGQVEKSGSVGPLTHPPQLSVFPHSANI